MCHNCVCHLYFWKRRDLSFVGDLGRTCVVRTVYPLCVRSKLRETYAISACFWWRMFSTRTTMLQRTKIPESSRWTNGNGSFAAAVVNKESTTFWKKLHVNEWTVSVSLFLFSLTMTLAKLYFNYGESWRIGDQLLTNGEAVLDTSNQYVGVIADVLVTFYKRYWWLIKATLGGLAITSFTWFIIYMDSSIPGVNPPSPFSPSKQRVRKGSRIHINYLVGVLHGILFFIYMCF